MFRILITEKARTGPFFCLGVLLISLDSCPVVSRAHIWSLVLSCASLVRVSSEPANGLCGSDVEVGKMKVWKICYHISIGCCSKKAPSGAPPVIVLVCFAVCVCTLETCHVFSYVWESPPILGGMAPSDTSESQKKKRCDPYTDDTEAHESFDYLFIFWLRKRKFEL